MREKVIKILEELPGKISFYYENLVTGESFSYHEAEPMMAASVIKLFVMTEAFSRIERGIQDPDEIIAVRGEDCVPPSGVLTFLHEGIQVTVMDLITLMIILSDNTATNILIDLFGEESINDTIQNLGCRDTRLRRKMYESEKSDRGIQNYITAAETGLILKKMYRGELVSENASAAMIDILKQQQLCSKIPFYLQSLPDEPDIAHKTGEDRGITHDVGIIYAKQPFIICFCGNETDTAAYERIMADLALEFYLINS